MEKTRHHFQGRQPSDKRKKKRDWNGKGKEVECSTLEKVLWYNSGRGGSLGPKGYVLLLYSRRKRVGQQSWRKFYFTLTRAVVSLIATRSGKWSAVINGGGRGEMTAKTKKGI